MAKRIYDIYGNQLPDRRKRNNVIEYLDKHGLIVEISGREHPSVHWGRHISDLMDPAILPLYSEIMENNWEYPHMDNAIAAARQQAMQTDGIDIIIDFRDDTILAMPVEPVDPEDKSKEFRYIPSSYETSAPVLRALKEGDETLKGIPMKDITAELGNLVAFDDACGDIIDIITSAVKGSTLCVKHTGGKFKKTYYTMCYDEEHPEGSGWTADLDWDAKVLQAKA